MIELSEEEYLELLETKEKYNLIYKEFKILQTLLENVSNTLEIVEESSEKVPNTLENFSLKELENSFRLFPTVSLEKSEIPTNSFEKPKKPWELLNKSAYKSPKS